jgi:hypothetical protein
VSRGLGKKHIQIARQGGRRKRRTAVPISSSQPSWLPLRRAGFGFLLRLPTGSSNNTDGIAIGLFRTAGTADGGVARGDGIKAA